MDRQGSTSENLATSMDDLRRLTMTSTTKIIHHRRHTNASLATGLIAALHPTMNTVFHRQIMNTNPANIVNTVLLHHYHLVISTGPILLLHIRNVHTKGQGSLGNLTGTLQRETLMKVYLNIMALMSLRITIITVLFHHRTTIITKTPPRTPGQDLTRTIVIAPLHHRIATNTKTTPSPSNCARVKPNDRSSPYLLKAAKQSATCTPTGPSTICTFSTSTASAQERRRTARSTRRICCC
jgi:hypothetical protein